MESIDSNYHISEAVESDSEDLESQEHEDIEIEDNSQNNENLEYPKYSHQDFNKNKIIEYLMSKNIILKKRYCNVCNNVMNLNIDNSKKDGLI